MPVLPEFSLSGKVAVFSTSGGDEAPLLAQALAEAGATVFAVARTQSLLDSVLAALGEAPHWGVVSPLSTSKQIGATRLVGSACSSA